MKKLFFVMLVLLLSSCYPAHIKHLKPVPVIVYNYPCSNLYMEIRDEYGWYYNTCRRMWFPRQYWGREHMYRGEPRFVQPIRPHQPPPVKREEPRLEPRRPEARPPQPRQERRPEARPQGPQRRPESRSQERRRSQ